MLDNSQKIQELDAIVAELTNIQEELNNHIKESKLQKEVDFLIDSISEVISPTEVVDMALVEENITSDGIMNIAFPGMTKLSNVYRMLLIAGIDAAIGNKFIFSMGKFLLGNASPLKILAVKNGVSIGIGNNASVGVGAGASLGSGIVYLPDGTIGVYGGTSVSIGFFVSVAFTATATIIFGGLDNFKGKAIGVFLGGGEAIVGQGTIYFPLKLPVEPIGFSIDIGLGAGVSPIEGGISVGSTGLFMDPEIEKEVKKRVSTYLNK